MFFFSIPFATELTTRDSFKLIFEPDNKLSLLATEDFISSFERYNLRDGKPSWIFLSEKLRKQANFFAIPLFSPYFEEVDEILQKLVEGGFSNGKLGRNEGALNHRPERTNNEVPALVLDMKDLEIGFLLCLLLLALSVVAFLCELASLIIEHLAKKARDLLIYVHVIRVVANMRTTWI